ncbi:MAG: hypothetical protein M3Y17_09610 [Actinomycetota bacterium]|nr:hypothetical protein [Actinomycetota bacterium]
MLKSEVICWPVTLGIVAVAFSSIVAAGLRLMLTMPGLAAVAGSPYLGFFCVGGGFLIVRTLAVALVLSMDLAADTSLITSPPYS